MTLFPKTPLHLKTPLSLAIALCCGLCCGLAVANAPNADSQIHSQTQTQPHAQQANHAHARHAYNPAFAPNIGKYPTLYQAHGEMVIDNYAWLYDDSDDKTRLIEQENAHTAHHLDQNLVATLRQEIHARSQANVADELWQDKGVFFKKDNGKFPKVFIKEGNDWALLLDTDIKKQQLGADTYQLGNIKTAPNAQQFAISYDTLGNEIYAVDIVDKAGKVLDTLSKTSGQVVWLDDEHLAYVNGYQNKVLKHKIGTPQSQDTAIYHKQNQALGMSLDKSSSDKWISLTLGNLTTAQTLFATPASLLLGGEFAPMGDITDGTEQYWEHYRDKFYAKISTEHGTLLYALTEDEWARYQKDKHLPRPIFVPTHNSTLESFAFVGEHLIVKVRKQGVHQIFYARLDDLHIGNLYRPIYKKGTNVRQIERLDYVGNQVWKKVSFDDGNYMVWVKASGFDETTKFAPRLLRLGYTSPSTPTTVRYYDLNNHRFVDTAKPTQHHQTKDYQTKRLWATGKDGTRLPITLVYKTGTTPSQDTPLLVYGYGAYGFSLDPVYGSGYISLLDRGFVYAFAHIRGGGELGQAWHDAGKLDKKQNSFDDFVAITQNLHQQGYGSPATTFAMGESAGGLVVANVCTHYPKLFRACVMQVPFLDALSNYHQGKQDKDDQTAEWGDPSTPEGYQTIARYNPYTNLIAKQYPNMFVIANRHDSRVDFVDSLKFIAKLRAYQTSNQSQHLITIQDGGHRGTGQNSRADNNAMAYAFILGQLKEDK